MINNRFNVVYHQTLGSIINLFYLCKNNLFLKKKHLIHIYIKLKKSIMFYQLIQDYTHHGGSIKKLTTIPKGTLISKEPFREQKDMEYTTVSYGNHSGYYLSKEIVESNIEFFKKLTESEFERELLILEFKNILYKTNETLSIEEIYNIVDSVFKERDEEPDPGEEFLKRLEEIDRTTQPFQSYQPVSNPYDIKCHCGNDGSQPCWSTSCPKRIHITYGTGTKPNGNSYWTISSTIHTINDKENNDQ
jgi:hypothetical protein